MSSRPPGAEAASHYAWSGNSAADRLTTEGPGSLCPPGLIRLSVGLEHPGDLIADLAQALRS